MGAASHVTETTDDHPPVTKRQVAAAVAGNALEFYDFLTYAYFAVQIGHAFFPNKSGFVSLILSLATFGVGFVLRPIGAIVIGRYADRHGRRSAMMLSFAMMGMGILGLALTPSYAKIGIVAPLLVVLWRLCQGFALGGEVGAATAFLVEAAPAGRRGLYASFQDVCQGLANVAGGLVGITLSLVLSRPDLDAWGWRVAFLIGALILPVGLWLRSSLVETLAHPEAVSEHQPATARIRDHWRIIVIGLGLIASSTVNSYLFTFMTTYARETLHIAPGAALAVPLFRGVSAAGFAVLAGFLTDRFGRRPLSLWPRVAFMALAWPIFAIMSRYPGPATLLGGVFVLSSVANLSGAALYAGVSESVRKEVRGMIFGGVYAGAVAVFGGTTQPIIAWLIHVTGDPLAPMWYAEAFTAIGVVAALFMRESAPAKTGLAGPRTVETVAAG